VTFGPVVEIMSESWAWRGDAVESIQSALGGAVLFVGEGCGGCVWSGI